MSTDRPPSKDEAHYEKKARSWDRWTTIVIVGLLLIPLPFARFMAWPEGTILAERIIMPWSHFQLCYTAFPGGDPVEETYQFTWKGELIPRGATSSTVFILNSMDPPVLKWQNSPSLSLEALFYRGEMLKLETAWQPVLWWPFKMLWQLYSLR